MLRSRHRVAVLLLAASLAAGCNFSPAPEATATLSADEVLLTAEAIAAATRQAVTPTSTPTPIPPSETPIQDTPTTLPTPTPSSPIASYKYTANVRFGPGEEYPVIDLFTLGQTADVVGRYDQTPIGTWWFIRRIGQGIDGWIWSGAVEVSGNTAGVPVLEKPPTPTPTAGPTEIPGPTQTPSATLTVTTVP